MTFRGLKNACNLLWLDKAIPVILRSLWMVLCFSRVVLSSKLNKKNCRAFSLLERIEWAYSHAPKSGIISESQRKYFLTENQQILRSLCFLLVDGGDGGDRGGPGAHEPGQGWAGRTHCQHRLPRRHRGVPKSTSFRRNILLAMLWIRIRMDPPYFGNLDPHPEVICWIWNRIHINLQIISQNVWNMSLFEHFLRVWSFIWKIWSG